MQSTRTRSLVLCGLSIALLTVGAAVQLPLGPVPFTLQSLMLILVLLILTPSEALVAVGGYLVLGAVGLPIFAGFKGGIGVLLGPTGGFLLGFFLAAAISALLRSALSKRRLGFRALVAVDFLVIAVAMLTYYTVGAWWFAFSTGADMLGAFLVCIAPFLIPDVLKAVAALICAQPIRVALGREDWSGRVVVPDVDGGGR